MSDAPPSPEQKFFKDPAIDRLMGMVLSLAAEVQVLRDYVAMTDLILARRGVVTPADRAAFRPEPSQDAAMAADSYAFAAEILAPLLGRQASRSEDGPHAH